MKFLLREWEVNPHAVKISNLVEDPAGFKPKTFWIATSKTLLPATWTPGRGARKTSYISSTAYRIGIRLRPLGLWLLLRYWVWIPAGSRIFFCGSISHSTKNITHAWVYHYQLITPSLWRSTVTAKCQNNMIIIAIQSGTLEINVHNAFIDSVTRLCYA